MSVFTQADRQEFVDALVKLRHMVREQKKLPLPESGICHNVEMLSSSVSGVSMVKYYAEGWPKHSGEGLFPIPTKGDLPFANKPWKDSQRRLRVELMTYMIGRVFDEGGVTVEEPQP